MVSLNWRPFLLSYLKCRSHVELLELVGRLECLQLKTRRTVLFLIDTKIFYALLKMSFGASYAPWHVDQFLLGHPLLYGVWHKYKYSVEITHKTFAPIIKFLVQGWDLKALYRLVGVSDSEAKGNISGTGQAKKQQEGDWKKFRRGSLIGYFDLCVLQKRRGWGKFRLGSSRHQNMYTFFAI